MVRGAAKKKVQEFDAQFERTRVLEMIRKGIPGTLEAAEEVLADLWELHKKVLDDIKNGSEKFTKSALSAASRLGGMLVTLQQIQIALKKSEEGDGSSLPPPSDAPSSAMLSRRFSGFLGAAELEDPGGEDSQAAGD